jgi:O-antigen/teichoic acid export membrane protein
MSVSNIVGPVLLYAGRVALAIMVSAEAVAYFSTPYDVVTRILLIPSVFLGVLFPTFVQEFRSDVGSVRALYGRSMLQNLVFVLPPCLVVFLFAKPLIGVWINEEFAEKSYLVAQLIATGVFINSFGQYSQALIQAYGRPDLTAKLHLAELVIYIPYMVWLVDTHGIAGAAIAWVVRVSISTVALVLIARACLTNRIFSKRIETK